MSKKTGEFLTIEMLAERKGFTVAFLRKAKVKYGLPFHKFGRMIRFLESDFDRWAAERRHEAS